MKQLENHWFKGRCMVIATRHHKELVIAPLFEEKLQVRCFVPVDLDTDQFGTFTGEIPRTEGALETARKKCHAAMDLTGYDVAVASEGSFGPHPSAGFINCNDELLLLTDRRNNLEIAVRELSVETNFYTAAFSSEKELLDFAEKAGFPAHGLILRHPTDETRFVKGVTDAELLRSAFINYVNEAGTVKAETDMRAMFNPTRMRVIERAAVKLVERISTVCPACGTPGYGVTEAIAGLLCGQCNMPTRSTLSYRYECAVCKSSELKKFPHGKATEDPEFCDYCNP